MTEFVKYKNISKREIGWLKQTYVEILKLKPAAIRALIEDENLIEPIMSKAFLTDYTKRVSLSFFRFQITQRDISELKRLQEDVKNFMIEEPFIIDEALDHGFLYFIGRFDGHRRLNKLLSESDCETDKENSFVSPENSDDD